MGKWPHLEVRAQYSLPDRTNVTNTLGAFGTISLKETQCKQASVLEVVPEASNPEGIAVYIVGGGMVNLVIVALYIKYRLTPHECSVCPLMSATRVQCLAINEQRQVWLAVTAKRFWIWESCLIHLFNLVWRSYMPSSMKIGHNLWPVEIYNWFWQLSTWWPSSDVAMRNNL